MRASSGSSNILYKTKAPQLTQKSELTLTDIITDTSWHTNAKAWLDTETSGEGVPLRPR